MPEGDRTALPWYPFSAPAEPRRIPPSRVASPGNRPQGLLPHIGDNGDRRDHRETSDQLAQHGLHFGDPPHRARRHALVPDQGRARLAGGDDVRGDLAARGPLGHGGILTPLLPPNTYGGPGRGP